LIGSLAFLSFTLTATLLYLSFGAILLASLNSERLSSFGDTKAGRAMAFFGRHSYSIYLWHAPVKVVSARLFNMSDPWPYLMFRMNLLYLILSLIAGVVAAKLIEIPFLRLREKIYDRKPKTVLAEARATA
jgi:peptidoglycan/LPS O-acetylase OafA/YrhL